jgi:hypothetical protein
MQTRQSQKGANDGEPDFVEKPPSQQRAPPEQPLENQKLGFMNKAEEEEQINVNSQQVRPPKKVLSRFERFKLQRVPVSKSKKRQRG